MKFAVAALASALVAAVSAREGPLGPQNYYDAAPGLQIGVANLTVYCNVVAYGFLPILFNLPITALVQFANPNYVKLGGPIVIESGIGKVKIDKGLTGLLGLIGVNSLRANVSTLGVVAEGTKEGTVDIAKLLDLTVPNTTVVGLEDLFITLPPKGGFSVVANSDGKSEIITAAVGGVQLNAIAHSALLGDIPAQITCPKPERPTIIGFIRAEPDYTPSKVPKTVYPIVDVPNGSLLGTAGITFDCNATGLGNFNLPTWVSGYVGNVSAQAGAKVTIQNAHGNVKLAASVLKTVTNKYKNAATAQIQVKVLNFKTINASPATFNGLSKPFTTDSFSLTANKQVSLDLPGNNGLLPDISFNVGSKEDDPNGLGLAYSFINDASGSIIVKSSSGSTIATVPFSCPPPNPILGLFSWNLY